MIDKKSIGKRLKQRREQLGLTQEQLAEKIDISITYMSSMERGTAFPRLEKLIPLLDALEISSDYILQDVLKHTAQYKTCELWEQIQSLPEEKRQWILSTIESMVQASK